MRSSHSGAGLQSATTRGRVAPFEAQSAQPPQEQRPLTGDGPQGLQRVSQTQRHHCTRRRNLPDVSVRGEEAIEVFFAQVLDLLNQTLCDDPEMRPSMAHARRRRWLLAASRWTNTDAAMFARAPRLSRPAFAQPLGWSENCSAE